MGGFGVIPGWKVKRELVRLGQQLKAIPEFFWEPFAIRAHNAAFEKGFPTFEGQVPKLPKVAIVLCFQPKGLAKSFFVTLAHLVENGYSPLVISNSTLTDQDKEKLKASAWRVVERPNFGYDFGGYRDGIFLLRKWNISPDRLVILNDSIWFPVWKGDKLLRYAEESIFDVTGTVLRTKDSLRYLESYFFSVNGKLILDEGFNNFWNSLKLTSNKYKVIRRGERGFGAYLDKVHISFGPIFSDEKFKIALQTASDYELEVSLKYMCDESIGPAKNNINFSEARRNDWSDEARNRVRSVLQRSAFNKSFQIGAAKLIDYSILKKSDGEFILKHWRLAWLRAFNDGVFSDVIPDILEEIQLKVYSDKLQ
jgi:hypothetical protein